MFAQVTSHHISPVLGIISCLLLLAASLFGLIFVRRFFSLLHRWIVRVPSFDGKTALFARQHFGHRKIGAPKEVLSQFLLDSMHTAAHGYAHRWTMLNSLMIVRFHLHCSHDVQLHNPESWCNHITALQLHINLGKGGKDWKGVFLELVHENPFILASTWMEQSKHENAYRYILLQALNARIPWN